MVESELLVTRRVSLRTLSLPQGLSTELGGRLSRPPQLWTKRACRARGHSQNVPFLHLSHCWPPRMSPVGTHPALQGFLCPTHLTPVLKVTHPSPQASDSGQPHTSAPGAPGTWWASSTGHRGRSGQAPSQRFVRLVSRSYDSHLRYRPGSWRPQRGPSVSGSRPSSLASRGSDEPDVVSAS